MSGAPTPGLQQERTMLAWRRTTLSMIIAALIIGRIALEESAPALVAVGMTSAVAVLGLVLFSLRRTRWSSSSPTEPDFELLLRDGRLPALLVLLAAGLCLIELALTVRAVA